VEFAQGREGVSVAHAKAENAGRSSLAKHLRDLILGGQDGLVNVLGLVLGLTAAGSGVRVVIVGGLAALLAESIAMAGVQYTSANAERDYYFAELKRERREIAIMPDQEREEVRQIFRERGLGDELLEQVVSHITANEELWLHVMMKDELDLVEPSGDRLLGRAALVGIACAVGSAIPILPYLVVAVAPAAVVAIVLSAAVLFAVGAYKAITLVGNWWSSGLQMLGIGIASAIAGYAIGIALHVAS
jgi:VIT1/CCC1 family predicted Fe2+/Mn2+ transporter